jgi:hypothetical protein
MKKFHVFFTAQYSNECFEYGRFGATSVNSLVDVKENDTAFLYDGIRSKLYGPLSIISSEQFYESTSIYGTNKRGSVNYPNRVSFSYDQLKCIDISKLFSLESGPHSEGFILNRTILSFLIANKQVHSTPLTTEEGEYLSEKLKKYGSEMNCSPVSYFNEKNNETVLENIIANKKKPSESTFEMLLMMNKHKAIFGDISTALVFNQFILGIQRQLDILVISDTEIKIIEIKKRDNITNPYSQIEEYFEFINSDYRLLSKLNPGKKITGIILLEEGNKFLDYKHDSENLLEIYSFTCNKDYNMSFIKS